MIRTQETRKLDIAYLFQNPTIAFSEPSAPQLHILHTLCGLEQRGHRVSLLALQPRRRVLFTGDLSAVATGHLSECHYGIAGTCDGLLFKSVESAIRRIQTELHLPYIALFDNYRMMSATLSNLRGYDLIHERYNKHTLGGMLASRRLGIPYVLEVNADPIAESEFRGKPLSRFDKFLFAWEIGVLATKASKIISVSSQLKMFLSEHWHVDPAHIAVLPNAADIDVFGRKYDRDGIRRKFGLLGDLIIMFVGGFYPWHDLNLLLDSFARILAKFPNAKLVLIGEGETKPDIEHKIFDDHLENSVILTGRIDHKKIPEMLSIADIAVAPNVAFNPGHGGSPLKLFEYMAAGKPIVCTRTGQIADIVSQGKDGLLVEPGDVTGFTQALELLISDADLRESLGRNASRKAGEEYTQSHYAQRLEEIYWDVLDRNQNC
jgi:glycosyltransferase involved in cell wall biosynthesis